MKRIKKLYYILLTTLVIAQSCIILPGGDESIVYSFRSNSTNGTKGNRSIHPSQLTVYTNSRQLDGARLTGSGQIVSEGLYSEEIRLTVAGSGNIRLSGTGNHASCRIAGSGNVDISDYPVLSADCIIAGSGTVLAFTNEELTATVSGSGNIRYRGKPSKTNIRVAGFGNVKAIE
jgi:hypothetical protein